MNTVAYNEKYKHFLLIFLRSLGLGLLVTEWRHHARTSVLFDSACCFVMFNHRAGVKVSRNAWERRSQVRYFCHPAFPGLKDRLFPWERLVPGQKDAYRDFKESGAKVIADSLRKVMHSVDTIPVSTAECERGFSRMNLVCTNLMSGLSVKHRLLPPWCLLLCRVHR